MEFAVQSPVADLGHVGGSIWPSVAPMALQAIRGNRTTIIFVNNRAQAEKMAARINATFSPTLSLELYARPFIGSGRFGVPVGLAAPRTFRFERFDRALPARPRFFGGLGLGVRQDGYPHRHSALGEVPGRDITVAAVIPRAAEN